MLWAVHTLNTPTIMHWAEHAHADKAEHAHADKAEHAHPDRQNMHTPTRQNMHTSTIMHWAEYALPLFGDKLWAQHTPTMMPWAEHTLPLCGDKLWAQHTPTIMPLGRDGDGSRGRCGNVELWGFGALPGGACGVRRRGCGRGVSWRWRAGERHEPGGRCIGWRNQQHGRKRANDRQHNITITHRTRCRAKPTDGE